jgi:serine/arginine repetitive matrix protein 2
MSYNGIGLTTARGSGTNGYVQRSLAHVRRREERQKMPEGILATSLTKAPNADLLEHQRKRAVELKCAEMEERMEEQGYAEEEIAEKISEYRQKLLQQHEQLDPKDAKYVRASTRCPLLFGVRVVFAPFHITCCGAAKAYGHPRSCAGQPGKERARGCRLW